MATITSRPTIGGSPGEPRPRLGGISIRPIDHADAPALSDLYASLSAEDRRNRFLGACADEVMDRAVAALADAPGAVAVLSAGGPRDGELVGHAALLADGSEGAAEVAFVVAGEFRGRGIGTRLMRALVAEARRRGLRRLVASTFGHNAAMRHLARGSGLAVVRDELDGGVEEIEVALD